MVAATELTPARFRWPDDTQRHAIVGTTGSGKTTFGLWCLARREYDRAPWIVIDAKRETLIRDIPGIDEIGIGERLPNRPGLFAIRPLPADFETGGPMSEWLMRVWTHEDIGLFIDEGYAFNRFDNSLKAILTQGRSKHIPVISLSQKPSWVSPFLFSESEFKSVFYLDQPADIDRAMAWLPARDPNTGAQVRPDLLADHESYWCHRRREFARFAPCPPIDEIYGMFDAKRVRKHWI